MRKQSGEKDKGEGEQEERAEQGETEGRKGRDKAKESRREGREKAGKDQQKVSSLTRQAPFHLCCQIQIHSPTKIYV